MSTFTEREQKLMAAACQSFEGEPKLDMEKFAQRSGLAVGSARNAWAALKKKLYNHDSTAVKATPTRTPATKSGKKRPPPVLLASGDNGSDDEEVFTPSKKPKTPKPKAKGKGKKTADSDDEDKQKKEEEEDDGYVKVKNEAVDEDFEEV
ncbi:hypothetical protein E4T48_04476 [Aureobasidium sp. EXF-10727]|nr:hypothetical protein E4T48_04476 [Aureobasidium sp. EXF-10727]KAI4725445.1 hypothetical protein E4T49_06816 [Aureobasidium sp. EXF-10728]